MGLDAKIARCGAWKARGTRLYAAGRLRRAEVTAVAACVSPPGVAGAAAARRGARSKRQWQRVCRLREWARLPRNHSAERNSNGRVPRALGRRRRRAEAACGTRATLPAKAVTRGGWWVVLVVAVLCTRPIRARRAPWSIGRLGGDTPQVERSGSCRNGAGGKRFNFVLL